MSLATPFRPDDMPFAQYFYRVLGTGSTLSTGE
jgi:hypothetical protein